MPEVFILETMTFIYADSLRNSSQRHTMLLGCSNCSMVKDNSHKLIVEFYIYNVSNFACLFFLNITLVILFLFSLHYQDLSWMFYFETHLTLCRS